ncbi:MAG: hypothetical protein IH977_01670 [Nitrospinae bacterium]|nr:hypothetical protein [Nitrospinota bacterium]
MPLFSMNGPVEKVRQRRSRVFVVLTYSVYAPGAKSPAALLDLAPPSLLRRSSPSASKAGSGFAQASGPF